MPRSPDYSDMTDEAARPPRTEPSGRLTPVLKPNEARAGVTHHNMRVVLAVSLAVAVIALIAVYGAFFG